MKAKQINKKDTSEEMNVECSIVLTYSDIERVTAIDRYYLKHMADLRASTRLTEEEKAGQRAFLCKYWTEELSPFLSLWSVKLYVPPE